MEAAVRFWLWGNGVFDRPPDVREVNKGHGRRRRWRLELWLEESFELEAEYGWPGQRGSCRARCYPAASVSALKAV
jgi:hypothetical protein